jgi:pilus assembly protein CpaB
VGRRVIAISAAVVLALVGVVAVLLYAKGADQRAVAAAQPRTVFVSQRNVPTGTSLNDAIANGLILETTVPAKSFPIGALTAVTEDNKGLMALTDIGPGEYIQSARFGNAPQGSEAIRVPNGQIAVSLTLSDPARVGTFLAPGSHIVLYATVAAPTGAATTAPAKDADSTTHVLFDDVLVIAVGNAALASTQSTEESTPTVGPTTQTLVTLALTPEQAPRLIHAIENATLYAGLRGVDVKVDSGVVVGEANAFVP